MGNQAEQPASDTALTDLLSNVSAGERTPSTGDVFRNFLGKAMEGYYAGMGGDPRTMATYREREAQEARDEEDRKYAKEMSKALAESGIKARQQANKEKSEQQQKLDTLTQTLANFQGVSVPEFKAQLLSGNIRESLSAIQRINPQTMGAGASDFRQMQRAGADIQQDDTLSESEKDEAGQQVLDRANDLMDIYYTPEPTQEQKIQKYADDFNAQTVKLGNGVYGHISDRGLQILHNNEEIKAREQEREQEFQKTLQENERAIQNKIGSEEYSKFELSRPDSYYMEQWNTKLGTETARAINEFGLTGRFAELERQKEFMSKRYEIDERSPQGIFDAMRPDQKVKRLNAARYAIARENAGSDTTWASLTAQQQEMQAGAVDGREAFDKAFDTIKQERDISNEAGQFERNRIVNRTKDEWRNVFRQNPDIERRAARNPLMVDRNALVERITRALEEMKSDVNTKGFIGLFLGETPFDENIDNTYNYPRLKKEVAAKVGATIAELETVFAGKEAPNSFYMWDDQGNPLFTEKMTVPQRVLSWAAESETNSPTPVPQEEQDLEAVDPNVYQPETPEIAAVTESVQNRMIASDFTARPEVKAAAKSLVDFGASATVPDAIIETVQKVRPDAIAAMVSSGVDEDTALSNAFVGAAKAKESMKRGKDEQYFWNLPMNRQNDLMQDGVPWFTGDMEKDRKIYDGLEDKARFITEKGLIKQKGAMTETIFEKAAGKVGLGGAASLAVDVASDVADVAMSGPIPEGVGRSAANIVDAYNAPLEDLRGVASAKMLADVVAPNSSLGAALDAATSEPARRLFNAAPVVAQEAVNAASAVPDILDLNYQNAKLRLTPAYNELRFKINRAKENLSPAIQLIWDSYKDTELGKDVAPLIDKLIEANKNSDTGLASELVTKISNFARATKAVTGASRSASGLPQSGGASTGLLEYLYDVALGATAASRAAKGLPSGSGGMEKLAEILSKGAALAPKQKGDAGEKGKGVLNTSINDLLGVEPRKSIDYRSPEMRKRVKNVNQVKEIRKASGSNNLAAEQRQAKKKEIMDRMKLAKKLAEMGQNENAIKMLSEAKKEYREILQLESLLKPRNQ